MSPSSRPAQVPPGRRPHPGCAAQPRCVPRTPPPPPPPRPAGARLGRPQRARHTAQQRKGTPRAVGRRRAQLQRSEKPRRQGGGEGVECCVAAACLGPPRLGDSVAAQPRPPATGGAPSSPGRGGAGTAGSGSLPPGAAMPWRAECVCWAPAGAAAADRPRLAREKKSPSARRAVSGLSQQARLSSQADKQTGLSTRRARKQWLSAPGQHARRRPVSSRTASAGRFTFSTRRFSIIVAAAASPSCSHTQRRQPAPWLSLLAPLLPLLHRRRRLPCAA